MATTTTNFGWDIPQSTDFVKDGATAIATLGQDIDTALVDLKGGTTGQVLSKNSNTDLDFTWVTSDDANAIQNSIVDAKGDLISATAADTPARLAVGANGTFLSADSTQSTGLKWTTAPSPASWNIVQQTAIDYTEDLNVAAYLNGNWVVGGSSEGAYSTDGSTWTAISIGVSTIKGLATNNTTYVAVGQNAGIRTSTNLTSWTSRTSNILAGEDIQDVIWDGAKFICVAGDTTSSGNKISTSTDGTTWTARLTTSRKYFSVANNGTSNYVAVGTAGADGAYATSTNGTSWTEATVIANVQLYGVVWNGTDFIIAGTLTGGDLRLWKLTTAGVLSIITTLSPSSTTIEVTRFLYDGTNYFIGLNQGSDAVTLLKGGASHCYQQVISGILPFNASRLGLAYNNGNYLGCAGEGTIMFGTEPRVL